MRYRFSEQHQHVMSVLRATREASGITQRALSGKLGRVYNYANLVENGQTIPTVLEFIVYIRACGASASEAMARVEELVGPVDALLRVAAPKARRVPAKQPAAAARKARSAGRRGSK